MTVVQPIVKAVRQRGDEAVFQYTKEFEHADIRREGLVVDSGEVESAADRIDDAVRDAIDYAIDNVRSFHRRQLPAPFEMIEVRPGIKAGERATPIDSVALYVPRGRGSFPSMLYMLAVPASLAGVEDIRVASPPDQSGDVDPACLYAAHRCGVRTVYRMGGAQAVAALAYGTESVAPVRKIIGPGSVYVSAAKRLVSHLVDIGLPAGPSESIILADEHADSETVALDLMIEAEHGSDSSALLVTPAEALGRAVAERIEALATDVPEPRRTFLRDVFEGYGGVLLVESIDEAIEVVNEYAPEHLQLRIADPLARLSRIVNAGEILLGVSTPFSVANYATGPNAVLPTGGTAKAWSPVSVRDFLKFTSVISVEQRGLEELAPHVVSLADYEGFHTHAQAVRERVD